MLGPEPHRLPVSEEENIRTRSAGFFKEYMKHFSSSPAHSVTPKKIYLTYGLFKTRSTPQFYVLNACTLQRFVLLADKSSSTISFICIFIVIVVVSGVTLNKSLFQMTKCKHSLCFSLKFSFFLKKTLER